MLIPGVAGGTGPKTFSLTGTLPSGLSFSPATGAISGLPTSPGSVSGLTITVSDASGSATSLAFGITIAVPTPTLAALTISPNSGTAGVPFNGTISGQTLGSTLSLSGQGSVGLSISGTTISGTPSLAGALNITETYAGATNTPRTTSTAVTIAAAGVVTLSALTISASAATVGAAFTATLSGRTSGSTLSLTGAGSAGLSISGATISGTPTTAGPVNVVETLTGATNTPRTTSGLATVSAISLGVLTVSVTTASVGSAFSASISGRTSGSTLSLSGAGAAGLTITGTVISGTPTTAGPVNIVEALAGATNTPNTTTTAISVGTALAWYKAYTVNNIDPIVAIDFENGLTWDGTTVGVALSTLVTGGTVTGGVGMQAATGITAASAGALKTALSGATYSVRLDVDGGTPIGANDGNGLISFGSDAPLFGNGSVSNPSNALNSYKATGGIALNSVQGTTIISKPNWGKRVIAAMSQDGTNRRITVGGSGIVVKDANLLPSNPATITLGSYAGAYVYGRGGNNGSGTAGYLKLLLVYPGGFGDTDLIAMSAPRSATLKRGLTFPQGSYGLVSEAQGSLKYGNAQPFTIHAQATCSAYPVGLSEIGGYQAGILTTNSSYSPNGGYELWVDSAGKLHFRIMANFQQPMYLGGVASGTVGTVVAGNIVDGLPHTFGLVYDGSSTFAGVKMFVDGSLIAITQEGGSQSTLAGPSNLTTYAKQYLVGNQIGFATNPDDQGASQAWERGFMWPGSIYGVSQQNVALSDAAMSALGTGMPTPSANTEFNFDLTDGTGTTAADGSSKGRTMTLTKVTRSLDLPRWLNTSPPAAAAGGTVGTAIAPAILAAAGQPTVAPVGADFYATIKTGAASGTFIREMGDLTSGLSVSSISPSDSKIAIVNSGRQLRCGTTATTSGTTLYTLTLSDTTTRTLALTAVPGTLKGTYGPDSGSWHPKTYSPWLGIASPMLSPHGAFSDQANFVNSVNFEIGAPGFHGFRCFTQPLAYSNGKFTSTSVLAAAAAGEYDALYDQAIAKMLQSDETGGLGHQGTIYVRPGCEMNLPYQWPWAVATIQDRADYKTAFGRYVTRLRAADTLNRCKVVFCPSAGVQTNSADVMTPDMQYIDVISTDLYYEPLFGYSEDPVTAVTQAINAINGLKWVNDLANANGKGKAVSELGCNTEGFGAWIKGVHDYGDANGFLYMTWWESNGAYASELAQGQYPRNAAMYRFIANPGMYPENPLARPQPPAVAIVPGSQQLDLYITETTAGTAGATSDYVLYLDNAPGVSITPTAGKFSVTGLVNDRIYRIAVAGRNSAGIGFPSADQYSAPASAAAGVTGVTFGPSGEAVGTPIISGVGAQQLDVEVVFSPSVADFGYNAGNLSLFSVWGTTGYIQSFLIGLRPNCAGIILATHDNAGHDGSSIWTGVTMQPGRVYKLVASINAGTGVWSASLGLLGGSQTALTKTGGNSALTTLVGTASTDPGLNLPPKLMMGDTVRGGRQFSGAIMSAKASVAGTPIVDTTASGSGFTDALGKTWTLAGGAKLATGGNYTGTVTPTGPSNLLREQDLTKFWQDYSTVGSITRYASRLTVANDGGYHILYILKYLDSLIPGQTYTFGMDVTRAVGSGSATARPNIYFDGPATSIDGNTVTPTDGITFRTFVTFTVPASGVNNTHLGIRLLNPAGTGNSAGDFTFGRMTVVYGSTDRPDAI